MAMGIHSSETTAAYRAASSQEPMVLELTPDMAAAVRRAARQRSTTPQDLLQELLIHALHREQRRTRARKRLLALTKREREVAELAGSGCTNREIAGKLVISPETVKTHMRHILAKLSLASKLDLRMLLDGQGPL